jgi:hypothetical protein
VNKKRKDSGGKPPFLTAGFNQKLLRDTTLNSGGTASPRQRVSLAPTVRIGVDTGGTFTDFVFDANGEVGIFKLASTPADPSIAITQGLRRIIELIGAPLTNLEIVHGTTVGTNALLQRRGARTALITTTPVIAPPSTRQLCGLPSHPASVRPSKIAVGAGVAARAASVTETKSRPSRHASAIRQKG